MINLVSFVAMLVVLIIGLYGLWGVWHSPWYIFWPVVVGTVLVGLVELIHWVSYKYIQP